ncbi:hypothetical protein NB643_01275 [Oxalobacter aliiformigenes]|uniref:hypothetical protein n=1 Tax=Oxalobacter aliiformigenes TaxID=2946593 RepID=UPI0022AF7B8D|nr:hypothetical protein [Oxalobacter aliiformigenes]WAV95425.1 hypothetical protein NB643_01275 [Oxalobacter aliiformigenes]
MATAEGDILALRQQRQTGKNSVPAPHSNGRKDTGPLHLQDGKNRSQPDKPFKKHSRTARQRKSLANRTFYFYNLAIQRRNSAALCL